MKEKKKKGSSHTNSPSESRRKKSRSRSKSPSSKKRSRRSQSSESRSTSRSPERSRSRSPLTTSLQVLIFYCLIIILNVLLMDLLIIIHSKNFLRHYRAFSNVSFNNTDWHLLFRPWLIKGWITVSTAG